MKKQVPDRVWLVVYDHSELGNGCWKAFTYRGYERILLRIINETIKDVEKSLITADENLLTDRSTREHLQNVRRIIKEKGAEKAYNSSDFTAIENHEDYYWRYSFKIPRVKGDKKCPKGPTPKECVGKLKKKRNLRG